MGYRHKRREFRLRFADPDMQGLVVLARSVPLGAFLDVVRLLTAVESDSAQLGDDDIHKFEELIGAFAGSLVEWNLEDDDGTPVPSTVEGLRAQDVDFVLRLVAAWVDAIGGVPSPLPKSSPDGDRSQEASLPMAPLSPNRAS